jgi:hypothetical protein
MQTLIKDKNSDPLTLQKGHLPFLVDEKLRKLQDHYNPRFQELIQNVLKYSKNANMDLINRAYEFSLFAHRNQLRKSGDPYFEHCLVWH